MMWVKNKKTGHDWYVSEEHGSRLLNSEDFTLIDELQTSQSNLTDLTVAELKELAKERGLNNYSGLKREELIELLNGE
ncbi:Rho termination factor N-terminal domain-containing protein [Bacillus albus]|nr:Rho termination factor N-terminal domain-containing protein [Bacillus albus]